MAEWTSNSTLYSGQLRAIREPTLLQGGFVTNPVRRHFRIKQVGGSTFLHFVSDDPRVELVKSPLLNDSFDRWYLFQPGQPPKMSTFSRMASAVGDLEPGAQTSASQPVFYPLKVPGPTNAPSTLAVPGTSQIEETRVYVISYITEFGEESEPSPPSSVTVSVDGQVQLSNLISPDGTLQGRNFTHIRVYRSVTGVQSAALHFVADIPYNVTAWLDESSSYDIAYNQVLSEYNTQPVDGLMGVRVHPSGALAAFRGREIFFSRPYLPHAWPDSWRLALPDEIVAIEVLGQNLLVMTTGNPALIYGNYPSSVGIMRYPFKMPCRGYNTVVGGNGGVYYASDDGLARFTGEGVSIYTLPAIAPAEWRAIFRDRVAFATRYGTQYVACNATGQGLVIDEEGQVPSVIALDELPAGAVFCSDTHSGDALMAVGNAVYVWDGADGQETAYTWRSKEFYTADPVNFEAVSVELRPRETPWTGSAALGTLLNYPGPINWASQVLLRVFADGKKVFEDPVGHRTQVLLTHGFLATVWQVEIVGCCRVDRVTMAQASKGMKRV